MAPLGWRVTWTEFPAGPQLLERLKVGAIDFGTTGGAPPIFAQAVGAALAYVGYEPPAPAGEVIPVPADSPIRSVAELNGRKVALNKGSNVHYLLVRALEHVRETTPTAPPSSSPASPRASAHGRSWPTSISR